MVVVAVVGCGALGSRVAGELAICGHRVPDITRVIGVIVGIPYKLTTSGLATLTRRWLPK